MKIFRSRFGPTNEIGEPSILVHTKVSFLSLTTARLDDSPYRRRQT